MARALGAYHPDGPRPSIDDRLVRRWAAAEREVPGWAVAALPPILLAQADRYAGRAAEIRRLGDEIREAAG